MTITQYIELHKGDAVKDAAKTGVPASITLAQGILESGAGNSRLYKEGNNSFGIKCPGGWSGETIYANDDKPNECFRKYDSVLDSFKDHSEFLKKQPRYRSLFLLPIDDYVSWANGLKKAGYATAANYHTGLIDLINKYDLHKFDIKAKVRRVLRIALPIVILLVILILVILYFRKQKQFKLN